MIRTASLPSVIASVLLATGVTLTGAAMAGPVGSLDIQGQARIAQQGADSFVRLSNTRHAWASGDRIDTGTGTAILDLPAGGTVGFGHQTRASLEMDGDVIRVDLEAGSLLYAIPESRLDLVVTSGDYVMSTRSTSDLMPVSATGAGSFGVVQRLDSGELRVSVRDGVMVVTDRSGSTVHQVHADQTVNFSGDGEARMIRTQVEAAATGGTLGGMSSATIAGLAFGGVAVVAAAAGAFSSSDSPASP